MGLQKCVHRCSAVHIPGSNVLGASARCTFSEKCLFAHIPAFDNVCVAQAWCTFLAQMRLALQRGAYFHIIGFAFFKNACLASAPCTFLEVGALGPFAESPQREFASRFSAVQELDENAPGAQAWHTRSAHDCKTSIGPVDVSLTQWPCQWAS